MSNTWDAILFYLILYAGIIAFVLWIERVRRRRADLDAQLRLLELREELDQISPDKEETP